jgi:hypothetical protein
MLLITISLPVIGSTENKLNSLTPGVADQQQTNYKEVHWLESGVPHWQEFIHKGNILESVDLHFGCWYSGSEPVTLSIWDTFGGPPVTSVTYPASAFPLDVQDWFTFDFPDVKLPKFNTYWIVVEFDPDSEYGWSGSHNNPYPDGASSHPDTDWDYAFVTYVDKSKSKIDTFQILNQNPKIYQIFAKLINQLPIFKNFLGLF